MLAYRTSPLGGELLLEPKGDGIPIIEETVTLIEGTLTP